MALRLCHALLWGLLVHNTCLAVPFFDRFGVFFYAKGYTEAAEWLY